MLNIYFLKSPLFEGFFFGTLCTISALLGVKFEGLL